MQSTAPRYEVRFRPVHKDVSTSLHSSTDPDEATIAFHASLARLSAAARAGEVLLFKHDRVRQLILRHPLTPSSSPDSSATTSDC